MTAGRASVTYVKISLFAQKLARRNVDEDGHVFVCHVMTSHSVRLFPVDLSRKLKSKTMCTLKCKKWVTYITIAFFFICGGIEYGEWG